MAKMHPMVSLELDDEDQLDAVMPMPMADRPRWPFGTRMSLTDKEMGKMKLDPSEAFVGGLIHLHAMARITSVSQNDTPDGQCFRMEIQCESMCIESEDEENEEEEAAEDKGLRRNPLHDR